MNEVWKVVSKSNDILGYVRCSYAWLDLVQKYYSEREMYVLLGNLSLRLEETYNADTKAEVTCVWLLFSVFHLMWMYVVPILLKDLVTGLDPNKLICTHSLCLSIHLVFSLST